MEHVRWVITPQSHIIINGATNVNNFTCRMEKYVGSDTLVYNAKGSDCTLQVGHSQLNIPLSNFNCGSPMITEDFQSALKADRYPVMNIKFLSLPDIESVLSGDTNRGRMAITLAGVTKTYEIECSVRHTRYNTVILSGRNSVCFSDFHLPAPKKMLGLIRVQEGLEVEFELHLKPL